MRKQKYFAYGLCFVLILGTCSIFAADSGPVYSSEMSMAGMALEKAFSEIGLPKGDRNLLVLTNAGYGQIGPQSTEGFLEITRETTGCSIGTRSLLAVHTSINEPLWCSIFRKDTGKLVFFKWSGKGFEAQSIDASSERILTPEGWKAASSGIIGQRLFSVVSISLTWAVNPPWSLLLAATFHDHFCPGVNSGYIAGQYLMEKLPLGAGDQYVFVVAPGKCAADALQMMFNTTAGKTAGYTMAVNDKDLEKYARDGISPAIVAMRVNRTADICEGRVLGFDWNKAYVDTGLGAEEMAPKGGPSNPMFWIARVKMSRELARLPKEKLLGYIAELKVFSGKADMAENVAGGDPYARVWSH